MSSREENFTRDLLQDCEIFPLTDAIKNETIKLKQHYAMKLPDAIIAATAKMHNLLLITADKDFKKLDGYINILILDV